MVRSGQIKRLARNETHSSEPKIKFEHHNTGVNIPGGIFGQPSSSSTSTNPQDNIPDEAPPAYSVSEATELIGGSAGPAGDLGYASPHSQVKSRRVPPPPNNEK